MRSRIWALATIAVVTAACSSPSAKIDLSTLDRTNVSAGLAPMDNGFAFANFGASQTSEELDVNDLIAMFGASACVNKVVTPCTPTAQAAAWSRMVNDARQSGHCEGLVVQAATRFNSRSTPSTAKLKRDADVVHGVIRAFATQFLPEVQDAASNRGNSSLVDLVNELTASLKDGVTSYTMGLYTKDGGHAVLPYAVDFTSETLAVIRVYDSNWPGMDRYVVVDFEKNEWYFSFSGTNPQKDECVWTGGPSDIDLTPLDVRTSANCPFCGDKSTVTKTMLLIRSTKDNWSITTEKGTYSPNEDSEVEGIQSRSIRSATCDTKTKLPEFVLATDSLSFEMTLPEDSQAYVSNGNSVIEIQTSGRKARKPIVIAEDSIEINDDSTSTTISHDNLAVVVSAPQATVSLRENEINVSVTTETGTENVSVTPAKPHQAISVENNNVIVEEPVNDVLSTTPEVPEALQQNSQPTSLPPSAERDLSNSAYVEEVQSMTTTTSTTTTTVKTRTSATTIPTSISGGTTSTSPQQNTLPSGSATTTTSTSSTTTTTTIPTASIRVVIQNGEGGIRFTIGQNAYPDSSGSPVWFDPNNQQNATYPGGCGPAASSLCNGKTYVVPIGQTFLFDWLLYNDNYLFEIQCGTGTSWYNPGTTYGNGTEVRSIGRCEIPSVNGNTTITFRQR